MTLGTDIAGALPLLRAEAESRMTETITAGSFKDGTDPETGDPIRTPGTERYAGKGRIRYGSLAAQSTSTGSDAIGQPVVVQAPYLSIPWGSPRLYEGDEVHVDASASDPALAGRAYQVAGNPVIGQVTAHRYSLTELA